MSLSKLPRLIMPDVPAAAPGKKVQVAFVRLQGARRQIKRLRPHATAMAHVLFHMTLT